MSSKGGRPPGPGRTRVILSGRQVAEFAREHTEEAIEALTAIGRGDLDEANQYIIKKGNRSKKNRSKKKEEPESETEIPWHVRLAAWIHILDRAAGKPFQSVEIFDRKDFTISFRNPNELREKLIRAGVPPTMLPAPGPTLIDAKAVRVQAEDETEKIRNQVQRR